MGDAVPAWPPHGRGVAEKCFQNGSVRHELADQHGVAAADPFAKAAQCDHVGVLDGAPRRDLIPELVIDQHSRVACVKLLHCHSGAVVELPSEHKPCATGA